MKLLALTIDYETWQPVPSGEKIDWDKDVFTPAMHFMDAAEASKTPLTFFAELGEYFWLQQFQPELALRMEEQWKEMVRRGHDVQIHLHPNWMPELGARFEQGQWHWDWSKSKCEDYPGDLSALIGRCKKALAQTLSAINPNYAATCFRAGGYRAQPFTRLRAALISNRIVCDSSVYRGGYSTERGYDYRHAFSNHQPYFPDEHDPQFSGSADAGLIEIPVFTYKPDGRWFLDGSESNKIHRRFSRFQSQQHSAGRVARVKELMGRVSRTSAHGTPLLNNEYFVAIGHTKGPHDFHAIARNLGQLRQENAVKMVTLSEMANSAREDLSRPAVRSHFELSKSCRPDTVPTFDRAVEIMHWVYQSLNPEKPSQGRDWETILRGGYAWCLGYAVVLGRLLQQEGFDVRWLSMIALDHPRGTGEHKRDSHEVILVRIGGTEMILDAMADRMIPHSFQELLRNPDLAGPRTNTDERYHNRRYDLYDTGFWYSRVYRYAIRDDIGSTAFWRRNAWRDVHRLRPLTRSPYAPEPPRRNAVVTMFVRLARLLHRAGTETPHLFGGSNADKIQYEYQNARAFLECLDGAVTPEVFDHKDVLDVGCGWGGKMIYFAEHTKLRSIHGFDLAGAFDPEAPREFARAKGLTTCHFGTGFAEDIPFEDNRFGLAIMEDVMEHVANPEKVLAECCRVLKPEGVLIIKFPSYRSMLAHHLDRAIHLPGLHYLLPIKTWAAGLNALLLDSGSSGRYEPFDEVVSTQYRKSITRNLNGLDFTGFRRIVENNNLRVVDLRLIPYHPSKGRFPLMGSFYAFLVRTGIFREFLANFIFFAGVKKQPESLS